MDDLDLDLTTTRIPLRGKFLPVQVKAKKESNIVCQDMEAPFTEQEWESIRLQTAIWCQRTSVMRTGITKIYKKDKARFINAAQEAGLSKSGLLVSAPFETMISLRGIYGVLCEADCDPAIEEEVMRLFKRGVPDLYTCLRKVNRNNMDKLHLMAWDKSHIQTHFAFDFGVTLYLFEKLRKVRVGGQKPLLEYLLHIRPFLSEAPAVGQDGISDFVSEQCARLPHQLVKYPANKNLRSVIVFEDAPEDAKPAEANNWDCTVKFLKLLFTQPSAELVFSLLVVLTNICLEHQKYGGISPVPTADICSCWPEAFPLLNDAGFLNWVYSHEEDMRWVFSIRVGTYYTGVDMQALLQDDTQFKDYMYTIFTSLKISQDDMGRIVCEYGSIDAFELVRDVFYLILMNHLKSAKATLYKAMSLS